MDKRKFLKLLWKSIKYFLLTINVIIIVIIAVYHMFDYYDQYIGNNVVLNNVEYELQKWHSEGNIYRYNYYDGHYNYRILIMPRIKSYCEKRKWDWLLVDIPKIYKIYKDSDRLVIVVPKDMDTTSLNLQLKDNFYERKVLGDVTRDYYNGVKKYGPGSIDLIVEYVDKE